MPESVESPKGYPFGVYFCQNCRTLLMWYPDIVAHPEMNLYPETMQCPTCNSLVPVKEKLFIKDIWTELVPIFIQTTTKYSFTKALLVDESHCHFMWQKPQLDNEN